MMIQCSSWMGHCIERCEHLLAHITCMYMPMALLVSRCACNLQHMSVVAICYKLSAVRDWCMCTRSHQQALAWEIRV